MYSSPCVSDGVVYIGSNDNKVYAIGPGNAPTAAFVADVTSGTAPLAVSFTDASAGSPTGWIWDFGDGTTSTVQNPTHTYVTAGTYTVSLNASSAWGFNISALTGGVTVLAAPVAGFTYTPGSGRRPLTVAFTSTSTGSITAMLWDFGDGSTSADQNAVHTYTYAGSYTVTLNVSNAFAWSTTSSNVITVTPRSGGGGGGGGGATPTTTTEPTPVPVIAEPTTETESGVQVTTYASPSITIPAEPPTANEPERVPFFMLAFGALIATGAILYAWKRRRRNR